MEEEWKKAEEDYKLCLTEYKREQRRHEQDQWRNYCTEIEQLAPTARLVRLLKSDKHTSVGMLRKTDGRYTDTPEEALDTLLEHHFPAAIQGEIPEPIDRTKRTSHEVNIIVTHGRVREAIRGLGPYKSTGPDGIYPKMLQEAGDELIGPLKDYSEPV